MCSQNSDMFIIADRSDYARDIANFLIHHLPEGTNAFGKDVPLHLTRISDPISSARVRNGFTDRHIVALGHSLGGDARYGVSLL